MATTEPTAKERAATICGRLGKLVGMALGRDGAGAGIALSEQQKAIEKDIRAAEQAAERRAIRELHSDLELPMDCGHARAHQWGTVCCVCKAHELAFAQVRERAAQIEETLNDTPERKAAAIRALEWRPEEEDGDGST